VRAGSGRWPGRPLPASGGLRPSSTGDAIVEQKLHVSGHHKALSDAGIRARYLYGPYQGQPNTQSSDMAELERLKSEWARYASEGLITLGMSWRDIGNFRGMGAGSAVIEANMPN
jgi:hypothetical protein